MLPFDQDICVWFVTPALLLSWRYYIYTNKKRILVYIRKHFYRIGMLYIHHCIGILDERQFSKDTDLWDIR